MKYSINKIAQIIDAQIINAYNLAATIEHLALDTRRLAFPNQSIFFALVSAKNDAHQYLPQAYQAGVRNFVISKDIDYQNFMQANFLKVTDTLKALQHLAAHHRAQFSSLQCIGITGSNGKTIVKEWLAQLLETTTEMVKSPKSYNSQIGVPLSLWQIEPQHQIALIEAGISQTNEMQILANMIKPNIGILTMIGAAHDEGFSNRTEKIKEKIKLFQYCQQIIYNADDVLVDSIVRAEFPNKKRITWAKYQENTFLKIIDIQLFKNFSILKIAVTEGGGADNQPLIFVFRLPFTDPASIDNACTCVTTLLSMGFSTELIVEKMPFLKPVEMRLELKAGVNRSLVINDAYNSDLTSLAVALDFAAQQGANLKRTLILSDILQSGQHEIDLHRKIANLIIEKQISRFIGIGKHIQQTQHFLPPSVTATFWATTQDFLQQLKNADFEQEVIVVKGARDFAFERVAARLSQKAHKTILEINLSALTHNFQYFKNLVSEGYKKNIKLMLMVKAAAYGNGATETARLLQFHEADYLAVAYADEGIALREAGIKLPIMVLNSEVGSFEALLRFDLETEVYSLSMLRDFANFAQHRKAHIHIKLDTGMRRLGFEMADIEEVIKILKENTNLKIASIFTHLAASENPLHDDFTHLQVQRYEAMYQKIVADLGLTQGGERPLRHVLNSSGIVRFPQFRFDMVRLGIGLYGVDGSEQMQNQLRVVQTLKATISQIKHLETGETVGYGRRGVMSRPSRIATISIGYADGLPRLAGLGRFAVWLHGKRAPIVGSVCMDMTMIDVTDIAAASEGDEVEIFGQNLPVQALAQALGTIPYEVFTNIAERVKRVYFME